MKEPQAAGKTFSVLIMSRTKDLVSDGFDFFWQEMALSWSTMIFLKGMLESWTLRSCDHHRFPPKSWSALKAWWTAFPTFQCVVIPTTSICCKAVVESSRAISELSMKETQFLQRRILTSDDQMCRNMKEKHGPQIASTWTTLNEGSRSTAKRWLPSWRTNQEQLRYQVKFLDTCHQARDQELRWRMKQWRHHWNLEGQVDYAGWWR